METKQLMVPVKHLWKKVRLRSEIHQFSEKKYPESQRLDVHFLKDKCFVKVGVPVPELSPFGRLQYQIKEKFAEYEITPSRFAEVKEG